MKIIAEFLEVKVSTSQHLKKKAHNYIELTVKTKSIKNNDLVLNYLTNFPLWSSKFLNYSDWFSAIDLFK